jgi:hypothetical protein
MAWIFYQILRTTGGTSGAIRLAIFDVGADSDVATAAGFAGTAGEKNFKIPVFALDFLAKLVQSKTLANRGRNDAEADDDNAALEEEDDEDEPSAALLNDSTL